MAYSDIDRFWSNGTHGSTTTVMVDYPDGTARLNSALSNPLTGSGLYCREFSHTITGNVGIYRVYTESKFQIASSVSGGAFVNPASNSAISLRSNVRLEGRVSGTWSSSYTNPIVGVFAFAPTATNPGIGGSGGNTGGGYELVLQEYQTEGNVRLVIKSSASGAADQAPSADPSTNVKVICSGSYALDQWYEIRMDVIPNGPTQKTINAYVKNGVLWDLVGTLVVLSTDSYWASTGYCGVQSMLAGETTMTYRMYIDDFKAYIETI